MTEFGDRLDIPGLARDDGLAGVRPALQRVADFARLLDRSDTAELAFRNATPAITRPTRSEFRR